MEKQTGNQDKSYFDADIPVYYLYIISVNMGCCMEKSYEKMF